MSAGYAGTDADIYLFQVLITLARRHVYDVDVKVSAANSPPPGENARPPMLKPPLWTMFFVATNG